MVFGDIVANHDPLAVCTVVVLKAPGTAMGLGKITWLDARGRGVGSP